MLSQQYGSTAVLNQIMQSLVFHETRARRTIGAKGCKGNNRVESETIQEFISLATFSKQNTDLKLMGKNSTAWIVINILDNNFFQ